MSTLKNDKIQFKTVMINRILHSWLFHMKFIKLADGSFYKFHINDHSCKILYLYTEQIKLGIKDFLCDFLEYC